MRRVGTTMSHEGLIAAFTKVFLHLLSDAFTSAGIQPPFFTLLQLLKGKSPFVLGFSGERVSWTDLARFMYAHGYDLRHFATMGIVRASVEMFMGESVLVTVQEVRSEFNRRSAGARLNLTIYLRGETTLEILTRSVLQGLGKEPAEWKRHAPVVEQAAADPNNHAPDCPCEECLSWEETF